MSERPAPVRRSSAGVERLPVPERCTREKKDNRPLAWCSSVRIVSSERARSLSLALPPARADARSAAVHPLHPRCRSCPPSPPTSPSPLPRSPPPGAASRPAPGPSASTSATSSSATTPSTRVTPPSWRPPPSAPTPSGRAWACCSRRSVAATCWTFLRCPAASPRTSPATSTRTPSSSSASRPTRRSSGPSSPTAASAWSRRASRPTATRWIPSCARSSRSTARATTTVSSTPTRPRSWRRAAPASSPACPTRTGAAASSATTDAIIRDREELSEQVRALKELKEMASAYGYDVSGPAATAREAIQWLYFGYLSAVKEQNGAAMSLGRTSTFLDVYLQRDLEAGRLTETQAQELVDDFVIKLRIVRFLRTKEYDALFSGDPTWVTEVIGGVGLDGRPLVTKTSFRFLQTLRNLGPAPEPNLTVFWSPALPDGFKRFCAELSVETSSLQYESDDLMRPTYGDDTGIACCVSAMEMGKQMQFFGARVNLAKCLLYALNGGRDEITGAQVGPAMEPLQGDVLDPDEVRARFDGMMDWLADVYVNAMNVIHYMHDKYAYERIEMALHDYDPKRTMAFGVAGLSVVADSLSAITHAQVRPIRDESGLIVDSETTGDFPTFGNNDDRVDAVASDVLATFMEKLRERPTYRDAVHTQSVLTITSNVVYGKYTGNTPDGRRRGEPFAPGANPMHGRDEHGFLASALSVAKLPYEHAQDGISFTASLVPDGLGATRDERVGNLSNVLDAYFTESGFHVNINVLDRDTLLDAMDHPENYPQLTIRVSGYAVNFVKLTREQQLDVVNRTYHGRM